MHFMDSGPPSEVTRIISEFSKLAMKYKETTMPGRIHEAKKQIIGGHWTVLSSSGARAEPNRGGSPFHPSTGMNQPSVGMKPAKSS